MSFIPVANGATQWTRTCKYETDDGNIGVDLYTIVANSQGAFTSVNSPFSISINSPVCAFWCSYSSYLLLNSFFLQYVLNSTLADPSFPQTTILSLRVTKWRTQTPPLADLNPKTASDCDDTAPNPAPDDGTQLVPTFPASMLFISLL